MDLNELQSLDIRELSKLAQKLNIDGAIAGINRQALIIKILDMMVFIMESKKCFGQGGCKK